MKVSYTYDEVIHNIMDAYESLDEEELVEEYNRLYPGQPIAYECDGVFARYMEGVPN